MDQNQEKIYVCYKITKDKYIEILQRDDKKLTDYINDCCCVYESSLGIGICDLCCKYVICGEYSCKKCDIDICDLCYNQILYYPYLKYILYKKYNQNRYQNIIDMILSKYFNINKFTYIWETQKNESYNKYKDLLPHDHQKIYEMFRNFVSTKSCPDCHENMEVSNKEKSFNNIPDIQFNYNDNIFICYCDQNKSYILYEKKCVPVDLIEEETTVEDLPLNNYVYQEFNLDPDITERYWILGH